MPVSFKVASHAADAVKIQSYSNVNSADDLLAKSLGRNSKALRSAELLQSSFTDGSTEYTSIQSMRNGFVDTVLQAYNQHHHLTIRPDDVWIAILSQFNFYVNAHAEELRSHFVAHEGKKKLIVYASGTRYSVDFGGLAQQMTSEIEKNVVDTELRDWILPSFTTTTVHDIVVCSVLMMSTLKAYFSYEMMMMCGLPEVTLEGEKADWEQLLARIDKLTGFGDEPAQWVELLRPILTRFVKAFDGEPDLDFWGRVCHRHSQGSGPTYLSGWITAFCVWSGEGKWQAGKGQVTLMSGENVALKIDGTAYPVIDTQKVPIGFGEVDVELDDNGAKFDCMMVSGHVAAQVLGDRKDGLRPSPAWFMFVKG